MDVVHSFRNGMDRFIPAGLEWTISFQWEWNEYCSFLQEWNEPFHSCRNLMEHLIPIGTDKSNLQRKKINGENIAGAKLGSALAWLLLFKV